MKARPTACWASWCAFSWALLMINCAALAQGKGIHAQFMKNKTLSFDPGSDNFEVRQTAGRGLLFEITRHVGGDARVDAGYSIILTFAVEKPRGEVNITSFKKESAFIYRSCRCIDGGYNRVTGGKIHLKRSSKGHWQADIEVSATGRRSGKTIPFAYSGPVYLGDEER